MKRFYFFVIGLLLIALSYGQDSRIDTLIIKSEIFKNERRLRIYLPSNYNSKKDYKILLLNDGQNVFGNNDIAHKDDWRVDEIADSLIKNKEIEPLIIVGINHMGELRADEYLPWVDTYLNPHVTNPQGKKYPAFLINEVIPLIKSKYNVRAGNENIGIGGFSYGGLISIYIVMMHPDQFGFVLVESPSLFVHNNELIKMARDSIRNWPDKVYLGVGTNEAALKNCNENSKNNKKTVDNVIKLQKIITKHINESEIQTKLKIAKCAWHTYADAAKRLPLALKFLFD